jgi:hypothetical protein
MDERMSGEELLGMARYPIGMVTFTLDGRTRAKDGAPARIMSCVVYTSRCARHQMSQTGSPDMRRLPGDVDVDESGHG